VSKKILIVDDSTSLRAILKSALESNGYSVTEAENGSVALEKITSDVNLMITDINMPVMNGIELIKQVRANCVCNKAIPILVLTTEDQQDLKDKAKEYGATGWLIKPFDEQRLLSVLKKLIG